MRLCIKENFMCAENKVFTFQTSHATQHQIIMLPSVRIVTR